MTHAEHLRLKAIELRVSKQLTIDEIAERLCLSRSTIYHWVRDVPIARDPNGWKKGQKLATRSARRKYRTLREQAYAQGLQEFALLAQEPGFRDFVCMYIGEGTKRTRNTVSICNSDPAVIILGQDWLARLSQRKLTFSLQYHADQDLSDLLQFWADLLGLGVGEIRLQRKSNSNKLKGRSWRSRYGVLTVETNDTYFRARLQAWMDRVRTEWDPTAATRLAAPGA